MKHTAAILLGAAAAAGGVACLIAPGRASVQQKAPFAGRYFAHRGLHVEDGTAPENSLPAFRRAAEAGYGIELDVHITKDDQIVVFHDDDLQRMCGVNAKTEDFTFAQLQELRLDGTQERIPLFSQVLQVYAGAGPMVLEFKTGPRKYELCEKTLELLRDYPGDVCIESFDPRIVRWFYLHAPQYIRGQLAQPAEDYPPEQGKLLPLLLANGLTNVMCRPQFIAYKLGKKPFLIRCAEAMGAMDFCWTSRALTDKQAQDGIIFEQYRPDLYL